VRIAHQAMAVPNNLIGAVRRLIGFLAPAFRKAQPNQSGETRDFTLTE
jgi:hypothetical protein